MRVRVPLLCLVACSAFTIPTYFADVGLFTTAAGASSARGMPRPLDPTKQTSTNLLIDGSKEPERVSDALAYRHLLSAIAVKKDASASDRGRTDAIVRAIALATDDRDVFINHLDVVRRSIEGFDIGRLTNTARREALDGAVARLRNALSSDGRTKLDSYVQQRVKSGIRIYQRPSGGHVTIHH